MVALHPMLLAGGQAFTTHNLSAFFACFCWLLSCDTLLQGLAELLWSQLALLQGLVTASPFAGPASCRESKQLGFFNALLDRVPYVPPPIQVIALPPSLPTSVALEHPIFISTFNQVPPPNPSSSAPGAFHKAPVWVEIVVVFPPKPIVV